MHKHITMSPHKAIPGHQSQFRPCASFATVSDILYQHALLVLQHISCSVSQPVHTCLGALARFALLLDIAHIARVGHDAMSRYVTGYFTPPCCMQVCATIGLCDAQQIPTPARKLLAQTLIQAQQTQQDDLPPEVLRQVIPAQQRTAESVGDSTQCQICEMAVNYVKVTMSVN